MRQDNGLLQEIRENYEEGWSADIDNRIAMESDLRFNAGEQWADDVRLERQSDNRPIITENRCPQFVRQVANDMRSNPPAIKVLPTSGGANKATADIMTGMVRNIEADGNTRRPYIIAGTSAARCGIGHFRILTDYVSPKSFEQKILIRPIDNPFAVVWDPTATATTREDADWCFVVEEMKAETFERTYPKATPVSFDNKDAEGWSARWLNASKDTIRVAEYWRKRYEPDTLCLYADGQSVFKSEKELVQQYKAAGIPVVDERPTERVVVECIKTNGHEILEEAEEWPTPHIPIVCVPGEEYSVGEHRVRHSVIRFAKDSQVLHNYWLSTQVEHLALQPKAPYVATAKMVEKYQSIWKNANKKNYSVLVYDVDKDAPGLKPQREMPPQSSSAFTEQIMRASDGMKATTGVYDAGLGAQGNETSGKAIQARDRQGDVSTFEFRDNLNAAVEYAGKILVSLIPVIYDTPRMVRILGEDGAENFAEINKPVIDPQTGQQSVENDLRMGEYDAQVSSGPSYTTRRQEASESMLQFVQTNPQAAQSVMDLVAKNMDWPGADEFAERLQKLLPPNLMPETDDPEEQQQRAQAAEQAQKQAQQQERAQNAEISETEAKAAKTQAEAIQTQLETAMQSGQMQQIIQQAVQMQVEQILAQMMAPQVPMNGNYPPQL